MTLIHLDEQFGSGFAIVVVGVNCSVILWELGRMAWEYNAAGNSLTTSSAVAISSSTTLVQHTHCPLHVDT